jgi:hypothetical protein
MVIKNTKWALNITRKYLVASSAIVSQIVRTLIPDDFDFLVKAIMSKNARESVVHKVSVR